MCKSREGLRDLRVSAVTSRNSRNTFGREFSACPIWDYIPKTNKANRLDLHRDPASRRRRRKRKSQIWDRKIWSRVPRDSDPWKTTLARTSSIYIRQTRHLVRECPPQKQDRNCQRVILILSWTPDGARLQHLLIDWPSVAMRFWLWLRID
jgi:hypothetical protein